MSRLIVVSNRVAVPQPSTQPAAGGLAVALLAALRRYNGIWFGWSGKIGEASTTHSHIIKRGGVTFAVIDLAQDDYDTYYNGYANRSLWPLFHYRTDLVVYDRRFQQGYFRVNLLFARALAPLVQPDDMIWVHDYHLICCGEELRRMGMEQRMGFFLHIPFPTPQILLTLPNHRAFVRALFAYDVLGFQTGSDLRALQDYVVEELGGRLEDDGRLTAFGRTIQARAFPIGLDTDNFLHMAQSAAARSHYTRMRRSLDGCQMIIGVDRLDYSKGLPQRLGDFERLLELYPENQGRVSLLQIAAASRQDVPEYGDIRAELEAVAGRINGRFADIDWVPVRYQNKAVSRAALAGLCRASRIGLITPYRDGMNLVAKEFVAAQNPDDPGVLVLSRFAGAATQLSGGALIVNPYDTQEVVDAIQRGLNLPLEERRERWQRMMEVVRACDVGWWRDAFVGCLLTCQERPAAAGRLPEALGGRRSG
ncbi:MAG: trehalose-6-phosphate synthase [Pseudomonadota bacterium]|nr:trehalose-6-phosphate synthase [Pseudomonadota bacterium]